MASFKALMEWPESAPPESCVLTCSTCCLLFVLAVVSVYPLYHLVYHRADGSPGASGESIYSFAA
eukprot:10759554-Alexandrium_andersonii.AAC.1